MGQFKRLVIEVLSLHEAGLSETEIARVLQIGRSVVEYVIEVHGAVDKGSVVC